MKSGKFAAKSNKLKKRKDIAIVKVLDLFCGTKSIANAFQQHGHEVYTVDWNAEFKPTLCADIGTLTADDIINLCGGVPDIIWASPDCTSYSVAAISYHRRKNNETGNYFTINVPEIEGAYLCKFSLNYFSKGSAEYAVKIVVTSKLGRFISRMKICNQMSVLGVYPYYRVWLGI